MVFPYCIFGILQNLYLNCQQSVCFVACCAPVIILFTINKSKPKVRASLSPACCASLWFRFTVSFSEKMKMKNRKNSIPLYICIHEHMRHTCWLAPLVRHVILIGVLFLFFFGPRSKCSAHATDYYGKC